MDVNFTLEQNITRVALQALMVGSTVVPKQRYRITDAVASTIVVMVIGETTTTISGDAIDKSNDLYGVYDITTDVFTMQGDPAGTALTLSSQALADANLYTDTQINNLEVNISRAALQALISGSTVVPERTYRITDAVGSTAIVFVRGETTNTISGDAINKTTNLYGIYNIGADTFTNQYGNLQQVTDLGNDTTNSIEVVGPDLHNQVIDPTNGNSGCKMRTVSGVGGVFEIINEGGFSGNIKADILTSAKGYRFPDTSGTFLVSVAGIFSSTDGNIPIASLQIALGVPILLRAPADVTNATTGLVDTGLTMPVVNGGEYYYEARICYESSAAAIGARFTVTGTGTHVYDTDFPNTATGRSLNNSNTAVDLPATPTGTTPNARGIAIIRGFFTASADGDLKIQCAAETAGSITVYAGLTHVRYERTN